MTNIIKIAYHVSTQRLMHVDKAANGLSCNCECLKCKEGLIAVQGKQRTSHFRHQGDTACEGVPETALHELGKQILIDNTQITIPEYGIISYSNPIAEKRHETIIPDVSADYEDHQIFFEIYVSHHIDIVKEKFYVERKYKSVEIDLCGCLNSTYDEIKNLILYETDKKRVIFWENDSLVKSADSKNGRNFIEVIIGIAIAVATFFVFIRPNHILKRKKRRGKIY